MRAVLKAQINKTTAEAELPVICVETRRER